MNSKINAALDEVTITLEYTVKEVNALLNVLGELPFLQAVAPEIAIFQVGYRNRYRHPKPEVFTRYQALGIRRLRTDESGALFIDMKDVIKVTAFRVEQARYWHAR